MQLRKVSELSIDPKRSKLCTRNKRRFAFVRLSCFEIIEAEVKPQKMVKVMKIKKYVFCISRMLLRAEKKIR